MTHLNTSSESPHAGASLPGENAILAAALAYAERGWGVLPLHCPTPSGCSCGRRDCKNVGKHPRTRNGLKDASDDSCIFGRWWSQWPDANIGVRTGTDSGIIVLDVDPRHDGNDSLSKLEAEHGKLPLTVHSLSGGQGQHFFFRHPEGQVKNMVGIAPGMDIRGDSGYIVAPPSKHVSGRIYQWKISPDSAAVAEPPQWLLKLMHRGRSQSAQVERRPGNDEPILDGQRNDTLASIGGSMRRCGLGEAAILAALLQHNRAACVPPLADAEVRAIAHSVAKYQGAVGQGRNRGLTKELADSILSAEYFAQDSGSRLYYFESGVYKLGGEGQIKRLVKARLEEWKQTQKWTSRLAAEVVEYIHLDAPALGDTPPLTTVNVLNGLLDLETKELRPHTHDFLLPVQLPVTYDPEATCPGWENFISEVFPADAQDVAWQIPGWLMVPDCSIQEALLLLGAGGNGKSTYLTGIRAFLGRKNISAETLQSLEVNRFSPAQLVGKLANVCSDLPSARLAGSSVFKAITGGDLVRVEYKFQRPFEVLLYVRFLFSANHLPRSNDASQAFYRRWRIVNFPRTFESKEQVPREVLDRRLAAPVELSGLLNKAVRGLTQVRSGGFIDSESMAAARQEFRQLTDPVAVWLEGMTVKSASAQTPKEELFRKYNEMAERDGRPVVTNAAFGATIHRLLPDIKDGQRTVGGRRMWVWLGLGLRSRE